MKKTITPQTNLYQLLADWPELNALFLKRRLACTGCLMAKFETLEDLRRSYFLDLDGFIAEIQAAIGRSAKYRSSR